MIVVVTKSATLKFDIKPEQVSVSNGTEMGFLLKDGNQALCWINTDDFQHFYVDDPRLKAYDIA